MATQLNNPTIQQLNITARRRFWVTRDGKWAIGLTGWVLASAVISHASLTLLAFCMLVAVLSVGAIQTMRNLRRLEVTRRLPDQAVAGRPIHLEIDLHNRRLMGTAQGLVITSPVRPAPHGRPPSVFLPSVPARGHVTERIELVLPNRGLYRFDELEITSRFPFGFVERSIVAGESQDLLVYPRLGKLSRRLFEFERESHPHQEGRRPGPASNEVDYHGLREFRDGDSPRWIHWPTSARRGRMMVREFEARHNRDVAVLLDPWLPANPEARDRDLLELAISFVATVCVELCGRHSLHLVLGIASNPPIVRHGQSSARLLRELLEQLAVVQGTSETPWDELFQELPLAWTSQMRITAVGPRPLDLASRAGIADDATRRRWRNLARRLVEVNVASGTLQQVFELH
jgi:uncharacterized protein (DUF58 family)